MTMPGSVHVTSGLKGEGFLMNNKGGNPGFEDRVQCLQGLATQPNKSAFVQGLEDYVDRYAASPRALKHMLKVVPGMALVEALILRLDQPSSCLAVCLPWEYPLAAMLHSLCQINREFVQTLADRKKRFKGSAKPDEDALEEGPLPHHKLEMVNRHPQSPRSFEEIRDDELREGLRSDGKQISPAAYVAITFHGVLTWWEVLKDRESDECEALLSKRLLPQRSDMTLRDMILLAVWEQNGFPRDATELDWAEFDAVGFGDDDLDKMHHRLIRLLSLLPTLRIEDLEAARDELFDELGITL